jgi:hypothetical protein
MIKWKVGDYVKDKYYHPDAIGSIISVKGNFMWVNFGDKNFRYHTDNTTLVRV